MSDTEDRRSSRKFPVGWPHQAIECSGIWIPVQPEKKPDVVPVQFAVKVEGFRPGGAR